MQNRENLIAIDLASFITVGFGYLFFIGWNYWRTYYGYFGIDHSMIVFPIHLVIVSAWSVLLIYFFWILYSIFSPRKRLKGIKDLETSVDKLGLGVLLAIYLIFLPLINELWIRMVVVFLFLALFLIVWKKYGDKKISFGKRIYDFHGILFLCVTLFFFSLVIANLLAKVHAKRTATGIGAQLVNIDFKTNDISFRNYVLIANMGGKYFISEKTDGNSRPQAVIINENDVNVVTLVLN